MISRTGLRIGALGGRRPRSAHRLALSPACWGISERPGWGHQIDPERVLSEAAAVGEGAITAGPPGFLPDRSDHARALLRRHRLQVVSGQVHAVLHHHEIRGPELAHIDGHAHWLAALGAGALVLAVIPERTPGAQRQTLSHSEWAHLLDSIGSVEHVCARHKLRLAVQPRFGSTIEGPEEIERLLVGSEAGVCLDIAHLVIAGADPVEVIELAAGRTQHVHLNDVDLDIARRVREHSLDFDDAVTRNLYRPVGEGGAGVARVIEALRAASYRGWHTLEQETRLPTNDVRPLGRISRSLEYVLPLLG
ncbi:MAG TPA: sugar phosphate isomerase/epimerase [Candidatus Dormibacteraeota bacterium]|nr:sugar phosphate isomerase/epimerase [Candidatus Dormibacteraeota bacterium]